MLKIGHRGAKGYAPENSLISFQKAIEMGVDGIELDVHLTSDGEIIVIHDETIDRTTDGKGLVNALSLHELKTVRIEKEYEIPTNLLYKKVAFNEKTKQNEIASFIDNFIKRDLPDKIKAKRDNGAALLDIIHERKILAQTEDKNVNALRGIKKSNRLLKSDDALSEEEVKALVKRKEAEDEVSVFGKSGEN